MKDVPILQLKCAEQHRQCFYNEINLIYKHMQNLQYRCQRNIDDVKMTS